MPDDDAEDGAWTFARGIYDPSRDLDELTDDARRRVDRLSPQSKGLLDLLLAGYGSEDIVAQMALTPTRFEEALAVMLAELDATSTIDAIRIGICAAYRPAKDNSAFPD